MSHSQPILSEFLTLENLATELGRNPRTLDRWHVLGLGPPRTHVGRKVLYRRTSVQKWLAAQEAEASHVERHGNDLANRKIMPELHVFNRAARQGEDARVTNKNQTAQGDLSGTQGLVKAGDHARYEEQTNDQSQR